VKFVVLLFVQFCFSVQGISLEPNDQTAKQQKADLLGTAVAIHGGTVVATAPYDDPVSAAFANAGSAVVFVENPPFSGNFTQQARIFAQTDRGKSDQFGSSVAVLNDTIAVGVRYNDGLNDSSTYEGAAYVFGRSGTVWSELQVLRPIPGVLKGQFGFSIDLKGDTLVVGAPQMQGGLVYSYLKNFVTGLFVAHQTLNPVKISPKPLFGTSLSLFITSNGAKWLLIGEPGNRYFGGTKALTVPNIGCATLHLAQGSNPFVLVSTLLPSTPTTQAFGEAVNQDGSRAVIGAPTLNTAYIFKNIVVSPLLEQQIFAPGLRFGASVAIRGFRVFVGAPTTNSDVGAVFPFFFLVMVLGFQVHH
jgi:hypothetical protein